MLPRAPIREQAHTRAQGIARAPAVSCRVASVCAARFKRGEGMLLRRLGQMPTSGSPNQHRRSPTVMATLRSSLRAGHGAPLVRIWPSSGRRTAGRALVTGIWPSSTARCAPHRRIVRAVAQSWPTAPAERRAMTRRTPQPRFGAPDRAAPALSGWPAPAPEGQPQPHDDAQPADHDPRDVTGHQ